MASFIIAGLIVNVWLLIIVYRQGVRKQLPWFAYYVAWGVLLQSVQFAELDNQSSPIYRCLLVDGVNRSSFNRRRRTRKLPANISRVQVGSVVSLVSMELDSRRGHLLCLESHLFRLYTAVVLESFVVGAEFAFRWGIFGIAVLTAFLSVLVKEPMDTREDAVVTGFGLASVGVLANVISFSLFGKKYLFFTQYAPSVGYFLAVFWWIWVFSRPVAEFGFKELGMGPEDIAKELRRYRDLTERMMRKKW